MEPHQPAALPRGPHGRSSIGFLVGSPQSKLEPCPLLNGLFAGMGLLNLVALGVGLIFLTLVFVAIIAFKRMRSRAKERKLLSDEVPWNPDFTKNYIAELPPAVVGVTQRQYNSNFEQGFVQTH